MFDEQMIKILENSYFKKQMNKSIESLVVSD